MKLRFSYLLVFASVLILVPAVFADDEDEFSARLNGYNEVPSVSTVARGEFEARLEDDGFLHYTLSYRNIEGGTAFQAHIHFSQRHVNGGVSAFLCGGGDKPACPAVSGSVSGVIDPTDIIGPADRGIEAGSFAEFIRAIRAGATYVNVHSTPRWPGGEIRGQIRGDDDEDDEDDDD